MNRTLFSCLVVAASLLSGPPAAGQIAQKAPAFTVIDLPGAGTGNGYGTFPVVINPAGWIAGYFIDAQGTCHGFQNS